MGHGWIIDVLTDLRAFAQQNDLPLLADQLAETARLASVEIASLTEGTPVAVTGDGAGTRGLSRPGGACGRA